MFLSTDEFKILYAACRRGPEHPSVLVTTVAGLELYAREVAAWCVLHGFSGTVVITANGIAAWEESV